MEESHDHGDHDHSTHAHDNVRLEEIQAQLSRIFARLEYDVPLHLFMSDAYSAGYYSYLWSDVMAADAWQAFEEAGDPWHPETARKFIEIILASGDASDRAEAYRSFRGRDPPPAGTAN